MSERDTLEQIREFWTQQAVEHGQAPSASWSDQPVIDMEVREITKRLADGDRVLDIGCANGYTTLQFVAAKDITIRGLDFIPEMVEQAKARLSGAADKMVGTAPFGVGDITALKERKGRGRTRRVANFSSSYFVGTRVIKPLLAKVVDGIDIANPSMEWNRWCSQLPAVGDYGTQKLFIFRKK